MTGSAPQFDAAKYKQSQRDRWNADATGWHRWASTLDHWFGGVTDVMLELARLAPGNRVLDIAAGAGEPALSAARRVGPDGFVLATDLSENIIRYAAEAATARGFRNFDARAMDGENLELSDASFDVVLCRFGLIFMPNPQRALSEWYRVLKPGGRVAIAVYSAPERNGWGAVPLSVIRRRASLPPPIPGQPGPFSLSGEGALEAMVSGADFGRVEKRVLPAPLRMQSAKECVRFERESFGGFNQLMAHLPDTEREAVWDEVEQEMRRFEGPNGFVAPCEPIVVGATK